MSQHVSRRTFVKSLGVAGVGYWAATSGIARAVSPSEKLNLAFIGLGRQGTANLKFMLGQNIVAVCDADEDFMMSKVKGISGKNPAAKKVLEIASDRRFDDYRKMFDKLGKEIDAVVISTPDHVHFHPALAAMKLGKHVYVEKPLCHNPWEVRQLTNFAREKKLVTQMGVQRHSFAGLRNGVELVRSGVLGRIKDVYSWVDSPRGGNYPYDKPPEPSTKKLNWDMWLGPTEKIPHRDGLAHYHFRFWWKYGTGEAGNLGCHVLDVPYWALDLKYPTKVTNVPTEKPDGERTPKYMHTTFEFAANDKREAVKVHWVLGTPEKLKEVTGIHKFTAKELQTIFSTKINNMFVGENGVLLCGYDENSPYFFMPAKKFTDVKPDGSLGKPTEFRNEWVEACKTGAKTSCGFDYSGPLSETVLLANIAFRTQSSFKWDGEKMESDNKDVTQYLRESYRAGWEV